MLLVCYLVILESCTTSLNVFVVGNVGDKTCTSNQVGISRLVEIKDMVTWLLNFVQGSKR